MKEIRLENIRKVFGSGGGEAAAVDGVNLTIAPGEFFFLLGPSGCGKTTLLRMIAGLVDPTAGRVVLGGRDVTHLPVEDRNTAMVFQNYALWPHMTVQQNVEFGPRMKGVPAEGRRRIAQANLARVEMDALANRKPNQLSGGQQQRVALARALAAQSDCLLLDEPLSNLDARLRLHMRGQLRELVKSTGATAVYVTHDQKEALSMADQIAVMNRGKIVQVGRPEELYNRPATKFVADFLGEANFVSGCLASDGKTVQTPAGELAVCASNVPAGVGVGAIVTCCVRPEQIRIATARQGAGGLAVKVESTMYLGEIRQFTCRLADGTRWKVSSLGGGQNVAAGQDALLVIAPQDVVLLTE